MRLPDIPQSWKDEIARDPNSAFSVKALRVRESILAHNMEAADLYAKTLSSRIGTRLSEKFSNRVGAIPCGPCKREIASLNHMTVEQAIRQKDQIVDRIEKNAKTSSQKWFLKLVMKADQLATGGGVGRWYILQLLNESIEDEANGLEIT
jgi:hypothetical protein